MTFYPYQFDEWCLRIGSASCLGNGGCKPDHLRLCGTLPKEYFQSQILQNYTFILSAVQLKRLVYKLNGTAENLIADDTQTNNQLGSEDVDADDTTVFGTDGRTYLSICYLHLLQITINEQVLHAGQCNASQSSGGPVMASIKKLLATWNNSLN